MKFQNFGDLHTDLEIILILNAISKETVVQSSYVKLWIKCDNWLQLLINRQGMISFDFRAMVKQ